MIKIREADKNDIEKGLLEVFIEGYRYHQKGRSDVFTTMTDEELKKELINNFERLTTIVIIDNNKIVGYLSYRIINRHNKKLDVDQLVIKESHRRKGLGKLLMEEAKKIALKNNCSRIELNCWIFNKEAISMYEHIGFKQQRIMYEMNLK